MSILRMPPLHVPPMAARQPVSDTQPGFADGLNSVANDFALQPAQMRRADNVRLIDIGAATKRGGTQRTAAALASAPVREGYVWRQSATQTYTLAMCNGVLSKTTYGALPATWTSIGSGFNTNATPDFAAFRDTSANVVYIATGGTLNKWDGATLTALPNAAMAAGICVYHDRLWGWGVAGALDSVFYSNLTDATSSTGGDSLGYAAQSGGQIIVRTFGQQDIVACATINTSLLIWHKRGISRITGFGQSDIDVTPDAVTADVGLVGKDALTVYDNIAYFVSERGVYAANEGSVQPLGTPEKPDPVLPLLQTLTAAQLATVKATYNRAKRELWVQLPAIGIYVFHTILKSWSGPFVDGYISPDTTCLFEGLDSSNQPILLRGDASGYVSVCDAPSVFLDNVAADGSGGTSYDAVIQCHRMYCGDATRSDAYRWAEVLAQLNGSDSVTVSWNTLTDSGSLTLSQQTGPTVWGSSLSTWGTGTWGAGGPDPFYVNLSGAGPWIDITITDAGAAASQYASVKVDGYAYGRR